MRFYCWVAVHEAMGYEEQVDAMAATGEDFDTLGMVCLLEHEHEGPHCFVPLDALGITFGEAEA